MKKGTLIKHTISQLFYKILSTKKQLIIKNYPIAYLNNYLKMNNDPTFK